MAGTKRNLELKARCGDLHQARRRARALSATGPGELRQCDTYFHVQTGRLKLRETEGKPAELIFYERPNESAVKGSDYDVIPIAAAEEFKRALSTALGVRAVVRKRRELYLWHNVRIHLDDVEGLGGFIEFEAVISTDDDEVISKKRLAHLCEALEVRPEDQIAVSYCDLITR